MTGTDDVGPRSDDWGRVSAAHAVDGTRIGFRSLGKGPGIIVLHGGLESSTDYRDLAQELSRDFTVHVVDRRGRGLSGPHRPDDDLRVEVADVRAVVAVTSATGVFGVSSGGVVALESALKVQEITRVAAYEPAIAVGRAAARDHRVQERFQSRLDDDDPPGAMAVLMKGTGVGPLLLRALPVPVTAALLRRFLDDADGQGDGMRDLLPTMRFDLRIAVEGSQELERYAALALPTLILEGTRSPAYLHRAITELQQIIPALRRQTLVKRGHTAAANRAQGGHPDEVAARLRPFFGSRTS